jgi:predicted transcriptional regulator
VKKRQPDDAIEVEAEPFELTPEEEAELAESIREADRGDVITAKEVLARLKSMSRGSRPGRGVS